MSVGRNIYELRKSRKLTQSELAGKLGVTEQSVSKWENDVCTPDVSLFPQLAKLFGVSIDRIFGFHLDSYDKEVQKIIDADRVYEGLQAEIEYYVKALAEYPNSDRLRLSLAHAYHMLYRAGETADERKTGEEKAVALLRELLGSSFDEAYQDEAYLKLAAICSETGRFQEALDMLDRVSASKYSAKIINKAKILTESKNYEELRRHTEKALFESYMYMDLLANFYYIALHEQGDFEQALRYCELRDRLLRLFDDGGETLYTVKKIENAFQRAHMLKRFGRKEDCYQVLLYLSEMTDAAYLITETAGHRISVLNSFFDTVGEIEPHMRSTDVKGYAAFMLSKFAEYFEGDARFEALQKRFTT
jgi:transcriptional regulator with XRE-family HTH domain